MDIHAIIRLDTVDSLQLRTSVGISQLIVGTATDNRTLDTRALKRAACDRNHRATPMLRIVDTKGLTQRHLQLQGKLQLGCVFRSLDLRMDTQRENSHQGSQQKFLGHHS